MLDLWQQSTDIASRPQPGEGADLPATFGESFQAAWSQRELASSSIKQENARNQAVADFSDQVKRAGGDIDGEYASRITPSPDGGIAPIDGLDVANTALAKLKQKNPGIGINPLTEDDIAKRAVQASQGAVAAGQAQDAKPQTLGSRVGSFLGGAASSLNDPMNLPLLAIAPEDSVGILGHALQFGVGAAASQAANEAVNAGYNRQVQPGYGAGQAFENIAEAGISGALMGGTMRALGAAVEHLSSRGLPTSVGDAVNVVKSEAQIDTSNVLPGVQGEAEHRVALGKSIDDILNTREVNPEIPDPLADTHAARLDDLMGMREQTPSPEETTTPPDLAAGVQSLAQTGGYDMPIDEAQTLADRVMAAKTPEEARFILNQVSDRPQTLADTLPSQADFAAEATNAARNAPQPPTVPTDQIPTLASAPDAAQAVRADIERSIDEAAKSGKALQIPIGVDADGEPIMGSAVRALNDIDKLHELADQIAQCAVPGSAQEGE